MKRLILSCVVALAAALAAQAQKFALVDMEYILSNIPAYERANEQLNQTSKAWQAEVEALNTTAETLYKNYQNESGPEGELFKKRQSLVEPIQEEIYNAVKAIATAKGFQLILDRASDSAIVFASPAIDISNEVLAKLGYSK